jgi:anhydro-N-acetylmuramic acid kinase
MTELFIGLMSGTSMDAVDAALVDLSETSPSLKCVISWPIPVDLRDALLELCGGAGLDELDRMGQLDVQMAQLFAEATNELLRAAQVTAAQVSAIGSHGQTVRHRPTAPKPYTLQIGDPNTIAELTGITTVADFRRRDMAAGGQGAPLVPAFHEALLRSEREDRVVVNIGGIANVTTLPADRQQPVNGFDTGPGNVLLDTWAYQHLGTRRDEDGLWAARGEVNSDVLERMLKDPYFHQPPPKSTGREYFHLEWLQRHLEPGLLPQDVQATLSELTAATIAAAVRQYAPNTRRLLVCGGGVHNYDLVRRLQSRVGDCVAESTAAHGLDPDWVEAMAFAWLAKRTLAGKTGNLPAVTGARHEVVLGGIYRAG